MRDDLRGDEKVSLYKREFLGINKACDMNSNLNRDRLEKIEKNTSMANTCLLAEFIIIIPELISILIIALTEKYSSYFCYFIYLILYLLFKLACIICLSVFLGRIIKYNFSYYCSDEITNELLKKENEKINKSILYIAINLGAYIFVFLLGCLTLLIAFLLKKYEDYKIKNLTNNNIPVLSKSSGQMTQKSELNIDIINNIPVTGETMINNGDISHRI